jgi:hypothetical protein
MCSFHVYFSVIPTPDLFYLLHQLCHLCSFDAGADFMAQPAIRVLYSELGHPAADRVLTF